MRKLHSYGPSLIVLATALAVLVIGPFAVQELTFAHSKARIIQASERLENNGILEELNQAYRDIAAFVEPSVVHISTEQVLKDRWGNLQRSTSSGSGWIYDNEGHIVTNYHVVKDAVRIQVQLHTGKLRDAVFVEADKSTDIAVIQIPAARLHPAVLAEEEDRVKQGDLVFAFGSPFDFRFSMSSGVVSGMGRHVGVIRDDRGRPIGYENFIQVDAAINPGNSGGPLTNVRGRVIGMNTAIATGRRSSFDEGQFAGIGLAIPIDMIVPVVDQLIETGVVAKGFLGIKGEDLAARDAQSLELRGFGGRGVVVTSVSPDGPAYAAGIEHSDIITHVNDDAVGTMDQLRSVISSMLPGDIARLRIWRDAEDKAQGTVLTVPVRLTRLDTVQVAGVLPGDQPRDSLRALGIARMSTSTPKLARDYGVPYSPGVLVLAIVPESQLDGVVEPGWIIVRVMGYLVRDVDDFFEILDRFNLRNGARITFLRPDGTRYNQRVRVPNNR